MTSRAVVTVLCLAVACRRADAPSFAESTAISAQIRSELVSAYSLSDSGVVERMLSLYPGSGRVISATGGHVLTSRDSVATGIRYFWNAVGTNMRDPKWEWGEFYIDVLSQSSAVVTATYRIPHRNPRNEPHVLGGAMTMVFRKVDGRWKVIQEHLSDLPQIQDSSRASMPTHQH
jgi:hypothetical protein